MIADTPAVRLARTARIMLVSYVPLAPISRSRFGSSACIASIAGGRRTLPDALQKPARGCSGRRCAQR